jgi:hypothetical protein
MMITMFSPARTCRSQTVGCEVRSTRPQLAELDDVRMLRPERRTFGDVSDGHGDETCDNDICGHCGSEDTQRVITDVDGHVLRGA